MVQTVWWGPVLPTAVEQFQQQRLLGRHPVASLLPDDRLLALQRAVGHLAAALGGEAVQQFRVAGEQFLADLEPLERR
ncbi:hypothetical protein SY89_01968 [Halolamina pelagica]|uniref:Uncharacterized protein n=1 Tax=Halolamina pelagica TaxID=699431 RepID=A0A0P7GR66_9EURY|nr:hypothetical protein SY89_01968 [Halolamina pelagica]